MDQKLKKKNKAMNAVKPVKKINKNSQNFQEISPAKDEVVPLHKLQDHRRE